MKLYIKQRVFAIGDKYNIYNEKEKLIYRVKSQLISFGAVHKAFLSWGDSYELDIPKETDPAFFVAVVIAIDNCLHNENNNS